MESTLFESMCAYGSTALARNTTNRLTSTKVKVVFQIEIQDSLRLQTCGKHEKAHPDTVRKDGKDKGTKSSKGLLFDETRTTD